MRKTLGRKMILIALACAVSLGLANAVLKAGSYLTERESYIEVYSDKVVYVPMTAQYVKYNGQVRKIAKLAVSLSEGDEDCKCPKCCDGYCYIIIYIDCGPILNPIRMLGILWIAC